MSFLELRIPPPLVGLLIAAAMWALAHATPPFPLPEIARWTGAAMLLVLGAGIALGGVISFHRAKTTVNPLKPEKSATLVTTGVYSFTRNPMYLGMALVLCAWSVYLSSPATLVGPVVFAAYITRFQILPEERVLDKLFGPPFAEYRKRVRRWI